ncbi:MAG: alpha/beta fold hydrolase [Streptosporangiaceae bacterium]
MTTLAPSPLLLRLADRPYAEVNLYCFPHGGGGPSVFAGWAEHLPPFVEPYALALPGREQRAAEPAATSADSVIEEVVDLLRTSSRPYALFGHSSGSAFATQVALALRRAGCPAPVLLGVSAFPAPHLAARCQAVREMFQADLEGTVLRLDGHAADAFGDPEVRAHALAAVGADVIFHSSYRHPAAGTLDCPISTFCGEQDPVVDPVELTAWADLTRRDLISRSYPGGHFYLREQRAAMVADLVWDLAAELPGSRGR